MKKLLYALLLITTNSFAQEFVCDNPRITDGYKLAINTVDINTRRGILAAGGDYGGEWTRDIAINSWNIASFLRPQVAEQSLWSVTIHKDTIGHQYWDKIIWTIAAYNHYLVTGEKSFLKQAYSCSANTMKALEGTAFDEKYGLFMGPSVFNDGIAGYPESVYDADNYSSGVFEHNNSKRIKCLSTNCVYYGAYVALAKMCDALNGNSSEATAYRLKADALKKNILTHLYNKNDNTFNYLIDKQGNVDKSQEGLGVSFAVIFGVIDGEKANKLIQNTVVSKYGITSIYPSFPRFSADKPGRHNNLIWPMVNGFFANAAVVAGNYNAFSTELNGLTHLALDEDKGNYNFWEIYNPDSGHPDGGYQVMGKENPNFHWQSCRYQTWSATAYLNMIQYGLLGLRFTNNGITFSPYLPENIHYIELKNVVYRQSTLDIIIKGSGKKIKMFSINGQKQLKYSIDSRIKGSNKVTIELE